MNRSMRLARLAAIIAWGFPTHLAMTFGRRDRTKGRTLWMRAMSRQFLALFGCKVQAIGKIPETGLIVANHLSYVDVLALGSICPAIFVAKRDVLGWPVFGRLASMAGTVFVDRTRRTAVAECVSRIRAVLHEGLPVVLFPEGTSSDGSQVLPFRASLIPPDGLVTPAAISYHLPGGSVAGEICYWRDMVFLPHVWNLLSKHTATATIRFGRPRVLAGNRKLNAAELHEDVAGLLAESRGPCRELHPHLA